MNYDTLIRAATAALSALLSQVSSLTSQNATLSAQNADLKSQLDAATTVLVPVPVPVSIEADPTVSEDAVQLSNVLRNAGFGDGQDAGVSQSQGAASGAAAVTGDGSGQEDMGSPIAR